MAKNILVIEDEAAILQLLASVFHDEGYSVVTAADGNTALDCLRGFTPDVVILDYMLPFMDGATFAHKARRHHLLNDAPILLLTAGPSEQWARDVGAAACLQKPCDLYSVVEWVRHLTTRPLYQSPTADFSSRKEAAS